MPTFRFDGLVPTDYPFARDAQGQNLGRVEPGTEREFEQAPDQWWVPAGDPEAGAQGEDTGAAEGDAPDPESEGEHTVF